MLNGNGNGNGLKGWGVVGILLTVILNVGVHFVYQTMDTASKVAILEHRLDEMDKTLRSILTEIKRK